jgi:hypothetical protein
LLFLIENCWGGEKRVKNSRYKKILIIILSTLLTSTTLLFTTSITQGQVEVPTYPYMVITPNPVGVGQEVAIIMWIHGAPPTAAGLGGQRYNFTIEVKKPGEDEFNFIYSDPVTLNEFYISDETGSTFTKYTPTMIGEYAFRLTYVGQIISRFNPETGIPGFPEPMGNLPSLIGAEFLPSEKIETLTVQEDPLPNPVTSYPLPEEYWTHPIEGQNTNWAEISSNWLGGAHIGQAYGPGISTVTRDLFQPDGTAPNSPHIMWTKPIEFGGVVGGTTEIPGINFYSGGSYEGRFTNSLIISGRLYYQTPLFNSGSSGYACVDLRTGETIWVSDDVTGASKGQLYDYETVNQHGVVGGLIWTEDGDTWRAYDAYSGQWVYNITGVPSGTEVYTKSGEIERYVLDYPTRQLSLWTSSATPGSPLTQADSYNGPMPPEATVAAFLYRPMGKNADLSANIKWSVTIDDLPGDGNPTIVRVIPGDLILGTSTNFPYAGGISSIPPSEITMWAINLDETRDDIGALLWIDDIPCTEDPDNPGNYLTRTLGPVYAGLDKDGVDTVRIFTMSDVQNFTWFGYNLDTGAYEWGPAYDDDYLSDYQYYGNTGFVAYGRMYVSGYGGEIQCFDLEDGSMLWEYSSTDQKNLEDQVLACETNTVWGYFPIFVAGIADGKIYVYNNEHSPNNPYYKGEKVRCLDAFTGEEIWNLMGMAGQSIAGSSPIIADGFLCYYNYYDNQIYCIGKGPTKTTITAPNIEVQKKSTVLIQGSVVDLSPGSMQDEQAKRFPHGLPAVSDDSMGAWMEYVYMKKPFPEEVVGVEVNVTAIDQDDNYIHIGTVMSEPSGVYAIDFTPTDPGLYKIVASFQGSDSYWPSYAETFLLVVSGKSDSSGNQKKVSDVSSSLQTSNVGSTSSDSLLIIALVCGIIMGGVLLAYRNKKFRHWSE